VLADPHHFPRWWPRVERVEGVDRRRWTSVMTSRRGRTVRIDYVQHVCSAMLRGIELAREVPRTPAYP